MLALDSSEPRMFCTLTDSATGALCFEWRHVGGHLDRFREMLELLEDKLREYRMLTLNPREYDDRTVTLSQLDSLRRELIDTARTKLAYIIFGKVPFLPDKLDRSR